MAVVAVIVLVASVTSVNSVPDRAVEVRLASSTAAASRAFGHYYEAENAAAADAYVERARTNRFSTGTSETCRLSTGKLSRRPSALGSPPLSGAAIRQRETAVAAIGAYLAALAAVAEGADSHTIVAAIAGLETRAAALELAANQHGQGDLFIEDIASRFGKAVMGLGKVTGRLNVIRQLRMVDVPVRRLLSVAAVDAARQHADTAAATTLAYQVWRFGHRGRRDPDGTVREIEAPFCSEPAIFAPPTFSPNEATDVRRPADRRGARLWSVMREARRANPVTVLRAMTDLDNAEMQLLVGPGNGDGASRAATQRERFERDVRAFAGAF